MASRDKISSKVNNSDTFLLSNMIPQYNKMNAAIWSKLEKAIRTDNQSEQVLRMIVISGPLCRIEHVLDVLKDKDDVNRGLLPILHDFFKAILVKKMPSSCRAKLRFYSYIIPNSKDQELYKAHYEDYACTLNDIEARAGILIWSYLSGYEIEQGAGEERLRRNLLRDL